MIARTFRREGYVVLPGVFAPDEVGRLRSAAERICATPSSLPGDVDGHAKFGTARSDVYARHQELRWVLFHEPLLAHLRALLGSPVVFIPEHPLHKGFYAGWHRDTSSPRRDGQRFYLQSDFRIVQVAIYLQDNSPQQGGGLDVVPRSHREVFQERWEDLGLAVARRIPFPLPRGRGRLEWLMTMPAWLPARFRRPVTVPTRAGDVVLFDLRLRHRATPRAADAPAGAPDKYALFLVCSADNARAGDYLHYIRDVRRNEAVAGHQFPEDLKEQGRRAGIALL
jgi:phytanoyl-CoA dioxygenase PhyH